MIRVTGQCFNLWRSLYLRGCAAKEARHNRALITPEQAFEMAPAGARALAWKMNWVRSNRGKQADLVIHRMTGLSYAAPQVIDKLFLPPAPQTIDSVLVQENCRKAGLFATH